MNVKERMKKVLSLLLCACMVMQYVPTVVFAAGEDGLCAHHVEHTAECGYAAAVAGVECSHVHSEDCYQVVACLHTCGEECEVECGHHCTVENQCITMERDCHHIHGDCGWSQGTEEIPCGHKHDEVCGYAEAVEEVLCDCVKTDENGSLIHTEGCGYVAPVEEVACGHTEHTDCGWAAAIPGTPCTHVCTVKVDSQDSCYRLLCSHAEGGHDAACGYAAAMEAKKCQYVCADCEAGKKQEKTVEVPVTAIEITAETDCIAPGETLQLTATVLPEEATNQDIIWSSLDESVLTVDENGLVIGIASGCTFVEAVTTDGSISVQYEVAVFDETIVTETPIVLTDTQNIGIIQKLETLQTQSGYRVGDTGGQCMAFAGNVFREIFGGICAITYYGHEPASDRNTYLVGRLCDTTVPLADWVSGTDSNATAAKTTYGSITKESVTELLLQAKAGDIIVTTYLYTNGESSTHTMVVNGITSEGLSLYQSNYVGNEIISINSTTWNGFYNMMNWSDGTYVVQNYGTVSLYRARNYNEIADESPDLPSSYYSCFFNSGINDSTGSMSSLSATPGKVFTMPQNGFSYTGFEVAGWNLKRSDGLWLTNGDTFATEEDATTLGYYTFHSGYQYTFEEDWVTGEDCSFTFYPIWQQSESDAETEEGLRTELANGKTQIKLEGSVTLDKDLVIPEGTTLTIAAGCTLSVPQGIKLTNNGSVVVGENYASIKSFLKVNGTCENNGDISVLNGGLENSGSLSNNGALSAYGTSDGQAVVFNYGTITNNGNITISGDQNGLLDAQFSSGTYSQTEQGSFTQEYGYVTGVQAADIQLTAKARNTAEIQELLSAGYKSLQLHVVNDLTLTQDITIPEGVSFFFEGDTLTIPVGVKMTIETTDFCELSRDGLYSTVNVEGELYCSGNTEMWDKGTLNVSGKLVVNNNLVMQGDLNVLDGGILANEGSVRNYGKIVDVEVSADAELLNSGYFAGINEQKNSSDVSVTGTSYSYDGKRDLNSADATIILKRNGISATDVSVIWQAGLLTPQNDGEATISLENHEGTWYLLGYGVNGNEWGLAGICDESTYDLWFGGQWLNHYAVVLANTTEPPVDAEEYQVSFGYTDYLPYLSVSKSTAKSGEDFVSVLSSTVGSGLVLDELYIGDAYYETNDFGIIWENNTLTIPGERVTGDILLYAYPTVNYTYHVNGGAFTEDTGVTGETFTDWTFYEDEYSAWNEILACFVRDGYTAVSFNTKADGTGTEYKEGDTLVYQEDITLYVQWEADVPENEPETRVDINHNFADTDIPDELGSNSKFDTVAEIEAELKNLLENMGIQEENSTLYDAVLMYEDEDGNWQKADETHFPTEDGERKLSVTLPVPDDTNPEDYKYHVVHMFSSSAFGNTPGDMEIFKDVKAVADGEGGYCVTVEVTGLSPFLVSAEKKVIEPEDPCANGNHTGGTQTCKGYQCERCEEWYGQANPDAHIPVYSANGAKIIATCAVCDNEIGAVTVDVISKTYDGIGVSADVTATGALANEDFPVTFEKDGEILDSAPVDAGIYTASITFENVIAKVNFAVEKAVPTVTKPIANNRDYNGQSADLVTAGSTTGGTIYYATAENGTYSTSIPVAADANEYTVWYKVIGGDNYHDVATDSVTVTISPREVGEPTFVDLKESYLYQNGAEIKPLFTLKDDLGNVIPTDQYEITYSNNTAVGEAIITITDKTGGNYNVSGSKIFQIVVHEHEWKYTVNDTVDAIVATCSNKDGHCSNTNGGTVKIQSPTDLAYDGSSKDAELVYANWQSENVSITYNNVDRVNVTGEEIVASIDVVGAGIQSVYKIVPATLPDATLSVNSGTYTGQEHTITVDLGTLVKGTDYNITVPEDMTNVGVKNITVTGKSNYTGNQTLTYSINKAVSSVTTAPTAVSDLTYTGRNQKLITAGVADGGIMQYSLDGEIWSSAIPTGKNAGEYTVHYKVVGDSNHNDVAWNERKVVSVTILKAIAEEKEIPNQKHFNYTAATNSLDLSSYIPNDCGETTFTLDTKTDSIFENNVAIRENILSYTTKVVENIGSGEIKVKAFMENYMDVTLTVKVELVAVTAQTERRIVKSDLTEVSAGLINTAFYTVDKIKEEQSRILDLLLGHDPQNNTAHYDVKLQFSPDGGKFWVDAVNEHFPTEGLTVTLPYPSGTGKDSHRFAVSHMFTSGNKAGTTETPEVTKTADGIEFTVTGCSPMSMAWSAIPFDVKIAAVTNGTVHVSPAHTEAGTQVTITVTPKSSYQLSTLTVKDATGNAYTVSTDNNGKYYFTMPATDVIVTSTFSKISTATEDPTNPKTGDVFHILFWGGMMTSLFGMAVLVLGKKKFYQ